MGHNKINLVKVVVHKSLHAQGRVYFLSVEVLSLHIQSHTLDKRVSVGNPAHLVVQSAENTLLSSFRNDINTLDPVDLATNFDTHLIGKHSGADKFAVLECDIVAAKCFVFEAVHDAWSHNFLVKLLRLCFESHSNSTVNEEITIIRGGSSNFYHFVNY
jgi:hypothetical protein